MTQICSRLPLYQIRSNITSIKALFAYLVEWNLFTVVNLCTLTHPSKSAVRATKRQKKEANHNFLTTRLSAALLYVRSTCGTENLSQLVFNCSISNHVRACAKACLEHVVAMVTRLNSSCVEVGHFNVWCEREINVVWAQIFTTQYYRLGKSDKKSRCHTTCSML